MWLWGACVKRIVVTGRLNSGSWVIRGEQLGKAIKAKVQTDPRDFSTFDLAVVVKRPRISTVQAVHAARIPLVWDIVDAWPQPEGNYWDRRTSLRWLESEIAWIKPRAIVAATEVMANDCYDCGFQAPVLALPHHAWPDRPRNSIRKFVSTVGYQGGVQYLGAWRKVLEAQIQPRGWKFVVNPATLAEIDIAVALREHIGYAARSWKSNVKLANAQGSGTPCVLPRAAGYIETARGGEYWADTPDELVGAFDALTSHKTRREVSGQLLASVLTLEEVAYTYREWLEAIC